MARDDKGKRVGVRKPYLGFCCLAIFFFTVVFAEMISPHDPYEGDLMKTTLPPAWEEDGTMEHLLGTDMLGRDVLSRLIYGSRISLLISVGCITIYGTIGVILGLISGFSGGGTGIAGARNGGPRSRWSREFPDDSGSVRSLGRGPAE